MHFIRGMRVAAAGLAALIVSISSVFAQVAPRAQARESTMKPKCGDPLAFQVLLDRQGFSPGEIDGRLGLNASRALAAFQETRGIARSGHPDCPTWSALDGENAEIKATYQITEEDARGPFADHIPAETADQSKLTTLAYRSILEKLAERFHASPALLSKLNPGVHFVPGAGITVPAVTPFVASVKPSPAAAPADVSLEVSREGTLRAVRADGSLAFFAPITSGSERDPLPAGAWKVTGMRWLPTFVYNPALFWDARPTDNRAKIAAGPNNPVGVVWIDINVEHYGLHGTPEPGRVGHAESHGCVRLTNWDAARLAALVGVGTPVVFR
jgi:lipoprotein-anchoring transpeptidase ErfK/SrfK